MVQDKVHLLRKTLLIVAIILIIALLGITLISTQIKKIELDYYGTKQKIMTLADSVDSFLIQNKIFIEENSSIFPSRDTLIENNMTISIGTATGYERLNTSEIKQKYPAVAIQLNEVYEPIAYEVEKSTTPVLNRGITVVLQEGQNGQREIKKLVKYNGKDEVYNIEIASNIVSEPVNKIIEVGTKIATTVSRSSAMESVNSIYLDEGFRVYNIALSEEYQKYAYALCTQYGIDYELFLAIMYQESRYNIYALGGGNSYGLCQIHVGNHANLINKLGVTDFFDPYDNMTAGAYMLATYYQIARNYVSDPEEVEVYALNAYNMGEGAYYASCFSQGILHRSYSTSVRNLRDILKANGGL